ncbi:MAG TPA: hypothetical protein DDW52_22430 [Planctomycetaceae bacterium]|nr:hypothetical protein [Planctomycetaceae bacterium]
MLVIDAYRFGDFSYASYDEIPDFRSRRYMPKAAANISMQKFPNGYYARYEIPLKEFDGYLDDLWERYAERSGSQRGDDIDEGEIAGPEEIVATFGELGWECPTSAIIYHSPTEMDGGGATYYVDRDSAIVLQQTGFW